MYVKYLKCSRCGRKYVLDEKPVMCINNDLGRLDIYYDYEEIKNHLEPRDLVNREHSMWRYLEFLPLPDQRYRVSLGEGYTPLLKAERLGEKLGLRNLYLKDETRNPTASFKDRGMSVSVSMANYFGYKRLVTASSGNAAASLAAYAARKGFEVIAFVPGFAAKGKIVQLRVYGAYVFPVKWSGSEDPTVKLMIELARHGYYPSPSFGPFNPYQIEGSKTISYEIVEQLDYNVPDHVFIPTGAASLLTGVYRGFQDLNMVGWINGYPRLAAVQPEGNHPFIRAWMNRVPPEPDAIKPWEKPPETIATGLEDTYPWDGDYGLKALYDTDGYGLVVSDGEILNAVKLLASYEGLFAEPSGAAGLAGLVKAFEQGYVDKNDYIVVLVTGHGLKDPGIVDRIKYREPPVELVREVKDLAEKLGLDILL